MVFFGVGLGFNFQPLTLAVQNAVDRRDMGVATSSATFTRQIGGTLGTAVFLSILFSQAGTKIPEAFAAARADPSFLAALQQPDRWRPGDQQGLHRAAACASRRRSGAGRRAHALQDSSFIQQLDPRLAQPFLVGFSDAMSAVFLVAAGVLVLAFVASLFLPHVDLGPKPGGRRGQGRATPWPSPPATDPATPLHRREATFGRRATVERPLLVGEWPFDMPEAATVAFRRLRRGWRGREGRMPGAVSGGCAARGGSGTRGCRGP